MSQELHEQFEEHIDKNLLDKSRIIEKLIEDYMKNDKQNSRGNLPTQ